MLNIKWVFLFVCMFVVSSCQSKATSRKEMQKAIDDEKRDTIAYLKLGRVDGNSLLIEEDIDMNGCVVFMPRAMTICAKGGIVRNGVVVGSQTKIDGKDILFDNVTIRGDWNVPEITTSLFKDLSYENALRNVMALASPKVKNTIVIEKGDYIVKMKQNARVGLSLCSNTELVLNGIIRLLPNNFKNYYIIRAKGENISIRGDGTIIGDKHSHNGSEGEWGMGLEFRSAVNASVKGLTIKDCWGDCIYVGGNSQNVLIEDCILDNGRRQGISVTKADYVTIRRCTISNVGGTAPGYAIDLEPNKGDTVDHVLIENVVVKNCLGGIKATRSLKQTNEGKPLSWIGSVKVRNCDTSASKKFPALFKGCDSLFVSNCKIVSSNAKPAILTKKVNYVSVIENTLVDRSDLLSKAKRSAKKILQRGGVELISIEGAKIKKVNANRIITE